MVSNKVDRIEDRRWNRRISPSVFLFILLLSGCASTKESQFLKIESFQQSAPYWVAVLPPEINPNLHLENFKSEGFWLTRMLIGTGCSYTTVTPEKDIRLGLISELSRAKAFKGIFAADSIEKAREMNADAVMKVYVEDYRAVLMGPNRRHLYVCINPLPIEYFIRSMTLEARMHWDIEVVSLDSGKTLLERNVPEKYQKTVRFALPKFFAKKTVNYLINDAIPAYVHDIFSPTHATVPADSTH